MAVTPTHTWSSGRRQAGVAGALHVAGYAALAAGWGPITHWFYHWAWWTFIVAIDGVVYAKRGDSLLRTRPRAAVVLALLSIVIWFHFETWNLRLQDWYYIGADPSRFWRIVRYVTAFATVIPGVFEIYDVLEAYRIPRRVPIRPLTLTDTTWRFSYALGAVMFVAPLLWPTYAFPLVWGTYVFLLDPLNAKWGGHSFWKDWGAGDITPFCRTLLAGFVAGGLWEAWNYWAPVKWIYTVPFFDQLKLFEMPVLGFLGFPPFALELMCMVTCITLLRNAQSWRSQPQPPTTGPVILWPAWRRIIGACIVFVAIQTVLTDNYTLGARRFTLAESIWGQTAAGRALADAGYTYPADVARALSQPVQRTHIAEALEWPGEDLELVTGPIMLAALPEVGPTDAFVLTRLNIYTLPMLARADPRYIATGFPRQRIPNGEMRGSPPVRRARVWIRAARREIATWPAWRRTPFSGPPASAMMPAPHDE